MAVKIIATGAQTGSALGHHLGTQEEAERRDLEPENLMDGTRTIRALGYPDSMTYPSGNEVRVGQTVWIDEGLSMGIVTEIIETTDEINLRGLNGPGIYIKPIGSEGFVLGVFYGVEYFSQEGIELVEEIP